MIIIVRFISFLAVVSGLLYFSFNNSKPNEVLLNETNKTCEECKVLSDHINVNCIELGDFRNASTCKIYYEMCSMVPCQNIKENNTNTCNYQVIYYNGKAIKIHREYIILFVVCILFIIMPFRQL